MLPAAKCSMMYAVSRLVPFRLYNIHILLHIRKIDNTRKTEFILYMARVQFIKSALFMFCNVNM